MKAAVRMKCPLFLLKSNHTIKCNLSSEEFVRHEVIYEPAKLYVKDIYRKTYECRNCRKKRKGSNA